MPHKTPNDDDRLSAYLDDQMTADQRTRFEQQLASDPTLRAAVDGLHRLGEVIRELPLAKAPSSLASHVTRKIEAAAEAGAGKAEAATTRGAQVAAKRSGRRRGLFWAAAVVAAAVLIMLYGPDEQQVAVGPKRELAASKSVVQDDADDDADIEQRLQEVPIENDFGEPRADVDLDDTDAREMGGDQSSPSLAELSPARQTQIRPNAVSRARSLQPSLSTSNSTAAAESVELRGRRDGLLEPLGENRSAIDIHHADLSAAQYASFRAQLDQSNCRYVDRLVSPAGHHAPLADTDSSNEAVTGHTRLNLVPSFRELGWEPTNPESALRVMLIDAELTDLRARLLFVGAQLKSAPLPLGTDYSAAMSNLEDGTAPSRVAKDEVERQAMMPLFLRVTPVAGEATRTNE